MSKIYIYHHLGLGDCFMCHGIIRTNARIYDQVITFAKPAYIETVRYMYRDLANVLVIAMDDAEVLQYLNTVNRNDVLCIGYLGKDWNTVYAGQGDVVKLDEMFYRQAELPLSVKWDAFYISRDMDAEMELFNRFREKSNIQEGKYIFIHDANKKAYDGFFRGDIGDGLDLNHIEDKSLPVIEPESIKFNMCHYIYLLENAAEIHVMNSSFLNLIELINPKGKLFYHVYPRPGDCLRSRKPWIKLLERT